MVQNIELFENQFKLIVQKLVLTRKMAQLTKENLAEMIHVDRRKIYALESGKIDILTLCKACDLLGITIYLKFDVN